MSSYASLVVAPPAAATGGNASITLSKSVDSVSYRPTIAASISADKDAAIPGDDIAFTTAVTGTGAVMTLTGEFHAVSSAAVTGTVSAWYDEVEYFSKASKAWVPVGGQQAAQAGYTMAVPSPATDGLDLTATPDTSDSGATYPTGSSGSDTILGTQIGPNSRADWSYTARVTLSAQQVAVLSDGTAAGGIRNVVHFEMTPRDLKNGQPYVDRVSFTDPFLAGSDAVTDVSVVTTLPNGLEVTKTSADVPGLASIGPGDSVDVVEHYTVPVPRAKGDTEPDQSYLAMLASAEGALLSASAVATGTAPSGDSVSAKTGTAQVVQHLPVVTIAKTGPETADAGSAATYDLALADTGGATATHLDVVDALPGGATGTVSDVPDSLAAGGSATAHAKYTIPASQPDGPLADTATVAWRDANGNAYGPVSASYETQVRSSYAGATLQLSPVTAGPDVVGTTQKLTATLTDVAGQPIADAPLVLTVSGANVYSGSATTNAAGQATFSYVGTAKGVDTAQATVDSGSGLQSNTASIGWVVPVQPVASTTVDGRFFPEPTTATSFVAKPSDTPAFGESFPSLAFNPPTDALPHNITGVGPSTRPFTDVTTDVDGNAIATIPAQGNGHLAGLGDMQCFDAAFTANLVISQAEDVTFRFQYGSGFLFGVGGGATRVNGLYENVAIGASTPFEGYPVVGADNTYSSSVRTGTITVHFPSAGSYPYEVDYTGCGSQLSLVMETVSFDADNSPLSIYVGYADGLRPAGSVFPYPWQGSPGVTFIGNPYTGWDSGTLRFDNTSDLPITLDSVTADIGSWHGDIWHSYNLVVPAHGSLILAQTVGENWDTSDYPNIHCKPGDGLIPQIHVTIDGKTTTYADTNQVLNTLGYDQACYGNESHAWERIGGASQGIDHPLPPAASLVLTPNTSVDNTVGSTQTVQVSAMDASGVPVAGLPVNLTVSGANTQHVLGTTDSSGNATLTYTGLAVGTDTLQVTGFVTGMRTLSNTTTVNWTDPPGTVPDPENPGTMLPAPAPQVTPDLPADGSVVTKPFPIKASFVPPDGETIASWKVTYQDLDPGPQVTLASGTGTPPDTLATFDTTLLANDTYAITVSATSSGGGIQSATSTVVVSGNLKLGRYTTTARDLTVPIGGLPFQLDRTYDSYDKRTDDFGVGWQLKLGNFRTSANRQLGAGGWSQYAQQCFFTLCVMGFKTSTPHVVTVVWPTGKRESFDFTPDGGSNIFWFGTAKFTARPGTTSTLEVVGSNEVDYFGDGNLYDGIGGDIYNPTRFKLTARDGTSYVLDVNQGLISETDANGNTVTVDNTGVHASSGPSLILTRDGSGRVTQASGLPGQTVDYSYDAAGNLESAVDSDGRSATYSYDSNHDLVGETGTGGVVLRSIAYGTDGRLASVTDGNGNTVQVSNDVGAQQQTYTDGAGNLTTVLTMDDLGDVVRDDEIADGTDRLSTFTYDSLGRRLSRTDPLGRKTTATYDTSGNMLTETDALGKTTTFTYNSFGEPLSVTDPRGGTTSYVYDSHARLITKTGPVGNVTSYDYDSAGHRTKTVDARGGVTTYTYDSDGHLVSKADPMGRVTSYAYDDKGRVVSRTDATGAVLTYGYDAAGDLTSLTDALGDVTTYTYDGFGRATSRTDPMGRVTHWDYDPVGNLAATTDPLGHVTRYAYDGDARRTSVTWPDGTVSKLGYNGFGDLTTRTDPLGDVTHYGYDADGEVVSRTLADGAHWAYAYDDTGRRTTVTDPAGGTTTTAYDASGLPVRVTNPAGADTSFTYDLASQLRTRTDALGHQLTLGYDSAGDVTSLTDALGGQSTYAYDADGERTSVTDPTGRTATEAYDGAGRPASYTDPSGHVSTVTYDAAGRPTKWTKPSGSTLSASYDADAELTGLTNALGNSLSYGYDAAGRRVSVTDPLGNVTHTAYDANGRRVKLTDALGGVVQVGYDDAGRIVRFVNPNGAATSLSYDSVGRVVKEVDPSGRTLTAAYDDFNRPTRMVNGRGQATTYTYTAIGSLASMTNPEGTDSFSYDALGRVTGFDDSTGTTSFSYDAANELTSASTPAGDVSYAYDAAGRRTGMTVGGDSLTYSYDANGWLSGISDGSDSVGYGYTVDGRLASVQRSNGVTSAYGYDATGHVTSIDHTVGGATQHTGYTMDAAGRTVSQTTSAGTETYTHDALGRITGVTQADGTHVDYAYDAAGNRLSTTIGGQTTTYGYDSAGRLTAVTSPSGTTSYTYNADDEVTARGADTFSYTSAGQLASADVGGATSTYGYDATGLRVSATTGGSTTKYGYDRLAAQPQVVTESGAVDAWGPGGLAMRMTSGGATFPLSDALESVRSLTDGSGAVTGTAAYDAFGSPTASTGASSPFGYTGALTDATGLVDLRARVYDPSTGRFMTPDSLVQSSPTTAGLNRFSYVGNDPVDFVDPTGHEELVEEEETIAVDAALEQGLAEEGEALVEEAETLAEDLDNPCLESEACFPDGEPGDPAPGDPQPPGEQPPGEQPPPEEPPGEQPPPENPPGEQPPPEEPPGEQPPGEQPPGEQPPQEEPPSNDPCPSGEPPALPPPSRENPYGDGPLTSRPLQPGERFNQVQSAGQTNPGGFGTFDPIPDQAYARNQLAIRPDWKGDVSQVQVYEAPAEGPPIQIQEGPVGPQTYNGVEYPGGGSQLEILNYEDRARLIPVGDQEPLPPGCG